ncbi:MAG: slipin family protein [Verrucomicrobiales bacterium]|nr:slipin family protein [Verrucomicrobiales bacterium]
MNLYFYPSRVVRAMAYDVSDHEAVLLLRFGSFVRQLKPGRHRFWRGGLSLLRIDTRAQTVVVQGQEVLSGDQVQLKLTATAEIAVVDSVKLWRAAQDAGALLYAALQQALRDRAAACGAEEFLRQKAGHGEALRASVADRASALGIEVRSYDVRDVMLPADLKRSFASALQQRQLAQAELEKSRAETASLRSLANAAKLLRDNPELLQLRWLQTLETLGAEKAGDLVLDFGKLDLLRAPR